ATSADPASAPHSWRNSLSGRVRTGSTSWSPPSSPAMPVHSACTRGSVSSKRDVCRKSARSSAAGSTWCCCSSRCSELRAVPVVSGSVEAARERGDAREKRQRRHHRRRDEDVQVHGEERGDLPIGASSPRILHDPAEEVWPGESIERGVEEEDDGEGGHPTSVWHTRGHFRLSGMPLSSDARLP